MATDKIRRILLKPLTRRRQLLADRKGIIKALDRLDTRAFGEDTLATAVEAVSSARRDRKESAWKEPDSATRSVALARALYASRRISVHQYVFFASAPVEGVHEGRWMDGLWDDDLRKLRRKMDVLEKKYNFKPDEYWPRGQAPKDYERLNLQYDAVGVNFVLNNYIFEGWNNLVFVKN